MTRAFNEADVERDVQLKRESSCIEEGMFLLWAGREGDGHDKR